MNICPVLPAVINFAAFLIYTLFAVSVFFGGMQLRLRILLFIFLSVFALDSVVRIIMINPCVDAASARTAMMVGAFCWISNTPVIFLLGLGFNGKIKIAKDPRLYAALVAYVAIFCGLTWAGRVHTLVATAYGYKADVVGPDGFVYSRIDDLLVFGSIVSLAWQVWKEKDRLRKRQGGIILATGIITTAMLYFFRIFGKSWEFIMTPNIYVLVVITGIMAAIRLYGFMELTPAFAASAIFNLSSEMMLLIEPDGRIAMANNAFKRKMGLAWAEKQDIYLEEIFKDGASAMAGIIKPGEGPAEAGILTGTGIVHCLVFAALISKGKEPAGTAVVLSDITELKVLQDSLKEYKDSLEKKVEERTRDLDRANHMLGQKARTAEEFTKASYHDLMEPVSSISRMLGSIRSRASENFDEATKISLDDALGYAQKMGGLIRDMRDYINIDYLAGQDSDCSYPAEIFGKVLAGYAGRVKANYGTMPCVNCPQVQLSEVLRRLTDNSVKFRGVTVPEVWLSCESRDGEAEFTFEDNGMGVPGEYMEKIFGVFEKLNAGQYPGNGIGLAICRRIVELHGGRMWAEASPHGGLAVKFTLPLPINQ